ncbi:MAG: hypothetical protein AAF602_02330 [Myxococcota bacterium]
MRLAWPPSAAPAIPAIAVDAALATVAGTLALRSAVGTLDPSAAVGLGLTALLLVVAVRRAGIPWHRASIGAATLVAAWPHADLGSSSVCAAAGLAWAIVHRERAGWAVPGVIVMGLAVAGAEVTTVAAWPVTCVPRRLGTAMPLATVAIGGLGLALAVRPAAPPPGTLIARVGPMWAGIAAAWLGTWRPPRPPLYNLPSALAMWGLVAAATGIAIHLARGGRPGSDRMLAIGLGLTSVGLMAVRTQPLVEGPVCGQLLAPLAILWLLALALIRLAQAVPLPTRVIDGLLLAQLVWMAGFADP